MLRSAGTNIGLVNQARNPHPRHHFWGFAVDQKIGNGSFFDRSGLFNHGVRGANLTDAEMFANAGYVTNDDPAASPNHDTTIHIPNLNFDYNGGETLIILAIVKATAEGSNTMIMGDGRSGTYPGIALRASTAQKMQLAMYDATNTSGIFGGASTSTPFDGTDHAIGIMITGADKKYGFWVDNAMDAAFGGVMLTFSSGTANDTRNSNTFQLGASYPAVAANAEGIAAQWRSFEMLRLNTDEVAPTVAQMTNFMKRLVATNGTVPILGGDF